MGLTDNVLDTTLVGYTNAGFSARRLNADDRFYEVSGRHVMVTGATGGIGRATVQRLARDGAIVHAVGRNPERMERLVEETEGLVLPWIADLSSMEGISRMADAFIESRRPLHALVNNVGVMAHEWTLTEEGFELTYATNLLGQYVLTEKLLTTLLSSAPAGIVLVSSGGMYSQRLPVHPRDFGKLGHRGTVAYARTKRGQVVLAEEWAASLRADRVSANAMHPGWADTAGVRSSLPGFRRITRPLLRTADQGADTVVWLVASAASDPAPTGGFYHDRARRPTHRTRRTVETADDRRRFLDLLAADAARYLDPAPKTVTKERQRAEDHENHHDNDADRRRIQLPR